MILFHQSIVSGLSLPSWVLTSAPGGSSGFIFGDYTNPKCPTAVGLWSFFSQTTGQITEDPTMKMTCASTCDGAVPATPTGATVNHDGSTTAGTVVTYTCSNGGKVYAKVSKTLD